VKYIAGLFKSLTYLIWILRRRERDLISTYNYLTPIVKLANGGYTLNRGYWNENTRNPLQAQQELCKTIGEFGNFSSAKTLLDIGSGFCTPAKTWLLLYRFLNVICVDLNCYQLNDALMNNDNFQGSEKFCAINDINPIAYVNATATKLPLSDSLVDRIVTLESHYHFMPFHVFLKEVERVLKRSGFLIIASPFKIYKSHPIKDVTRLGSVSITLQSKGFDLSYVKSVLQSQGFQVRDILFIGSHVFAPLANFYAENRSIITQAIRKDYPSYIEKLLYKLILKTKAAYEKGMIDYGLIKCSPP